jgi:hypothetical protein
MFQASFLSLLCKDVWIFSNGNQGVFALPKKWQAKDGSNETVVD